MSDLLFYSMLAFLVTHELDAMRRHEWRLLPLTSFLPEKTGEQLFIWAHVPLIVVIIWFGCLAPDSIFSQGLSGFAIFHIVMHWFYRNHAANEFTGFTSWALIIGPGLLGASHLMTLHL